ncbi:hypothetical protein AAHA92_18546 [Salvia divinorum]|uniref:Uncharacterized protein n=1 Tax=Salvia divinorum TaxID=28513 RepID=A0ABD1H2G0_SALDI
MFDGGGGARWPGHDDEESNFDPNTQYDPNLTADSYVLDEMKLSPASQARKKKVKVGARKLLDSVEKNEEYTSGRQNYTDDETMLLMMSSSPGRNRVPRNIA